MKFDEWYKKTYPNHEELGQLHYFECRNVWEKCKEQALKVLEDFSHEISYDFIKEKIEKEI